MRARRFVLAALALAFAGGASGQGAPPIEYETFTLDNGLQFIVHEDHSVPVVHVQVWYDVGSAHEPEGRSGFAHLFEHMMFINTENLEKGEFDSYINRAGGNLNGTTNKDRTAYFETVPSNQVNVALWLEADRMHNLVVNEENFQREREVVKEERRLRVDNQPYGAAMMTIDTLAMDWEPYRHTVIGSMDDLNAATAEDAREFYERFYVPNNAAVVVAGDVTTDQVRGLAEAYFAHIPAGPEMAELPPIPAAPRTDGERRVTLQDDKATLPLHISAYTLPPDDHPDIPALELMGRILMTGESSRMNQRLVKDERAALQVFGGASAGMGPGTLTIFALPNQGVALDRIEALVWEELERIREEGVSERELEKAQNQTRASMIMSRLRVSSKASQLQQYRRSG
ncbi:MAG: insulinase family protein, partial [Gemmatimonadetes bacterium]|nr:insulinase family protein [Gemmatimonadota bacterium]NIQ56818.1 insulinase family protein [Gemmatimonadota bacterium]NIU77004.1 insulinase family protein [Gammaproteobacteria bacterium]NIX46352.1 insulinase family protein [Gemmatimonadota bacterium]NIY09676.1 insulinase family protein [Gemmatimonadota bacterium]